MITSGENIDSNLRGFVGRRSRILDDRSFRKHETIQSLEFYFEGLSDTHIAQVSKMNEKKVFTFLQELWPPGFLLACALATGPASGRPRNPAL